MANEPGTVQTTAEIQRAATTRKRHRRIAFAVAIAVVIILMVIFAIGVAHISNQVHTIIPPAWTESIMDSIYLVLNGYIVLALILTIGAGIAHHLIYKENLELAYKYAYRDPLTGGSNLNEMQEKIAMEEHSGALVSIGIKSFKDVNTVCGRDRGDEVICAIWQAIQGIMKDQDAAAHISGDQFVLFLHRPEGWTTASGSEKDLNLAAYRAQGSTQFYANLSPEAKIDVAKRLTELTDKIHQISKTLKTPPLEPNYGVCRWAPGMDATECYSNAFAAKKRERDTSDYGKNIAFFDRSDYQLILEEAEITTHFADALQAGEFEPFYQPKFTPEGKLIGAEALARWRKPDGNFALPNTFVPLFERNGMIGQLDYEIFRAVCQQQAAWQAKGLPVVPVSVNLSRASLQYPNVCQERIDTVQAADMNPALLPIEITESALSNDARVAADIAILREFGFPVHMDDFGSGYSSLSALGKMSFDAIKLDKSLVDRLGDTGSHLLTHTVALAHEMELSVTAEGVETKNQLEFLAALRCDAIQGFYFSKPLPAAEFEMLLR